jgi:hypothetical protein
LFRVFAVKKHNDGPMASAMIPKTTIFFFISLFLVGGKNNEFCLPFD